MAEFDLSKYQEIELPPKKSNKKFDLSKYQEIDRPPKSASKKSIGSGIGQGFMDALYATADVPAGFANAILNTGSALTDHDFVPKALRIPHRERLPMSGSGIPLEAGKLLGSLAAAIPTEGAALMGMGALKGVKALHPIIQRILAGAAGGAASAPGVDGSPVMGAALGAAGGGVVEGGATYLRKLLGKNVKAEPFVEARGSIPAGIKAPIGELIDSPAAQKWYGRAEGIAGSGAGKPYEQLYDHMLKGSEELLGNLPEVENPSQFLYDDMKSSYKKSVKKTEDAYDVLAKHGDLKSIPFDRKDFDNSINEGLQKLHRQAVNPTQRKLLSEAFNALEDYKKTPIKTFDRALNVRRGINRLLKKVGKGDDIETLYHLKNIKTGLDKSIEESSKYSSKAFALHKIANNARIYQGTFEKINRKDNSPFFKIFSKGGTPDNFISSYLKTNTKGDDASGLLSQLTRKLSPEAKGVLANAHINPRGEMSLGRQLTKLNKMSPGQRRLLFDDKADLANQLSKLSNLYSKTKGAAFTPRTGFSGAKSLQMLGEGAGLAAFSKSHNPSALAMVAGLPLFGQGVQRTLRSNWLKDFYLKALKNTKGKSITSPSLKGAAARSGLVSALGGENNGS